MSAAEVGAGRPALEAVGEQRSDLGERQCRVCGGLLGEMSRQQPVELAPLPGVAIGGRGQRVDGPLQLLRPGAHRMLLRERVERGAEAVDQLGEASSQFDPAAVDRIEWQGLPEPASVGFAEGNAEQQPTQARLPGAGLEHVEFEVAAVGCVEAPVDARPGDPGLDLGEVVVVEPEAAPDRLGVREVEHLRGGQSRVGRAPAAARRRAAAG